MRSPHEPSPFETTQNINASWRITVYPPLLRHLTARMAMICEDPISGGDWDKKRGCQIYLTVEPLTELEQKELIRCRTDGRVVKTLP